jgi:hypothetical protein
MADRAYVCVTMGPFNWMASNTSLSYIRVPSKVKVDQPSEITVKNGGHRLRLHFYPLAQYVYFIATISML